MKFDTDRTGVTTNALVARREVRISPWVKEPLPAWDEYLTAHDVVRLMRRPPWLLSGMAILRQFPRKRRFHGLKIWWLKSDVVDWTRRGTVVAAAAAKPVSYPRGNP